MPERAVLFDLGGTLIGNVLTPFETFQVILSRKGIHVSAKDVENAFDVAQKKVGDYFEDLMGKIPLAAYYRIWDSHVLRALEISDDGTLTREISDRWMETCGVFIFPDVLPALSALQSMRVKTGIVSNAYEEEIYTILHMVGLDTQSFDAIVGTDMAKERKPNSGIFIYALQKMRVQPSETIYVGDNIEKDYRGARNAGIKPILIVRSDMRAPEDVAYIRELMDLMKYIH